MPIVEHNDVIEAFPSNRPDDAFSEGVLPGRSRGDKDLAHSQALHPPDEHIAVDGISIAEQVLRRRLFWESLDQLVGSPGCGWVVGDVDMDEFATVVSKDQESGQRAGGERQAPDDEEAHAENLADMSPKKGAPRGGWARRGPPHVLGHGELGDLIAEEAEFGLDPAPAPGRVVSGHAANQRAKLKIERGAAH